MAGTLRRTTIPEVLEVAIDLERKTMELYAGFVRLFAADDELRQFWFNMARGEAAHCGALLLVESMMRHDPELSRAPRIPFDASSGIRLLSLLTGYRRELRRGVTAARAFEMAIDIEGSELEDLVVDLLQVVRDPGWRDQAVKMLIHDLGDLSYMIEKRTRDKRLLARADELVERRMAHSGAAGGAGGASARARRRPRPRPGPARGGRQRGERVVRGS